MRAQHFAIEQKRNIRVKFFLKLMETLVRTVPRSRFMHGEDDLACLSIDPKKVDDGRIRDPCRFPIMIVLLILRHWAE